MKIKRIDNLYVILYMFLFWVAGIVGFYVNHSYLILLFLFSVCVFCFLFMEICDRICEAIKSIEIDRAINRAMDRAVDLSREDRERERNDE